MSTFVSLETALPHSAAMMAMNSTASGPPAPGSPDRVVLPRALAAQPTVARENSTMGGAFNAQPMATAMAAPLMAEA